MSRIPMRGTRASVAALMAAWLVAGAGLAIAQDKPAPPLQGPKVTPNRPPELEDEFAPGKRDKFTAREPGVRMAAYIEVINKLKGDTAPAGLRLSAEQEQKIQVIGDEFRAAMKEFAQKNNAPGEKPNPGEGNDRQRRQRLEEMRRDAPKPVDAQARIWNVLNEPQQKFVKGELDTIRAEQNKKRGEEYMKREMEKRKGEQGKDAQPAAGRPQQPGGPPPEVRERVQRIIEKLRNLPPEERDRLLQRLEEELDRRTGSDNQMDDSSNPARPSRPTGNKPGKDGQRRIRPGGDELPSPSMDDVKVPKPDPRK